MHILIDVQGLQSESRYRGIGRSTLAISKALIRSAGGHRVSILLNGMYSLDNVSQVRQMYAGILPAREIFTFSAQGPVAACNVDNLARNQVARVSRDVAIAHINPDIVFVISFFEGHGDDYVVSIPDYPVNWRTVCVCHDLIPLLNPDTYLSDANFRQFYLNKLHEYERADAIYAISESAADEVRKYTAIDHQRVLNISSAVDPEFCVTPLDSAARQALRERYQLPEEFIMTLAMIEPRKNIEALICAFGEMSVALRNRYPLVLACKIRSRELEDTKALIHKCGIEPHQVVFTGYLPDSDLIALYNICKVFVFPSLHEGFGLPPLEAMSCGAPTLSSNATSLPEVIGWEEAMFDPYDINAIRASMERALTDEEFYQQLKVHALQRASRFSWDRTAKLAWAGFEQLLTQPAVMPQAGLEIRRFTAEAISKLATSGVLQDNADRLGAAWALARNSFSEQRPRLLIDASVLVEHDARTGIQRVVRSILNAVLVEGLPGYQVRPVYCPPGSYYRYANRYQAAHFGPDYGEDEPVLFCKDDVMVVVDLTAHLFPHLIPQLAALRRVGTKVYFVIHDIIPIHQPQWSIEGIQRLFPIWLRGLVEYADGIICVSRSVADDVRRWVADHGDEIAVNPYLTVDNFHLGADLEASLPTFGVPDNAKEILATLVSAPSFLMVGTIEPRKAHVQVLDAFELLWAEGNKANLVLVGKEGWNVEALCQRIANHPQLNRHLFWLTDISDEFLGMLYRYSSALVVPSYAEGFGLPLIEAAQQGLPLILRDIPVFREIAGDHAWYFSGEDGVVVSNAIKQWIGLRERNAAPDSSHIPWLTWKESAKLLLSKLPLVQSVS